jgi:hypothetical protein
MKIADLNLFNTDLSAGEVIRMIKKSKAKRMNPKATKTTNIRAIGSRPHDPMDISGADSTHGSKYQASLGGTDARLDT